MTRFVVEPSGFDRVGREFRTMGLRAEQLRPLGYQARSRWHEAEQRVFERRPWAPRAASTIYRYNYPVRRWRKGGGGPMRQGRFKSRGVGSYTGAMQRGLTKPFQKGVRDTITAGRGTLVAQFSVSPKSDLAHAALFHGGAGSRPARPVVVFDRQATRDLAQDTTGYLMGRSRRSGGGRRA